MQDGTVQNILVAYEKARRVKVKDEKILNNEMRIVEHFLKECSLYDSLEEGAATYLGKQLAKSARFIHNDGRNIDEKLLERTDTALSFYRIKFDASSKYKKQELPILYPADISTEEDELDKPLGEESDGDNSLLFRLHARK